MPKVGYKEAESKALRAMALLGYPYYMRSFSSRSVFQFYGKGTTNPRVLLQYRTEQEESRYWFGLLHKHFENVDLVVLYVEEWPKLLMLPSEVLKKIYLERKEIGDCTCFGKGNDKWGVEVYLDEESLSPQGSKGDRYSVSPYFVQIPKKQPTAVKQAKQR